MRYYCKNVNSMKNSCRIQINMGPFVNTCKCLISSPTKSLSIFHYHNKSILLGVEAQLKFHLTEAIRLCDILEQIKDENVSDGATNIHR